MLVVEDFKYLENDENLMEKLQRNALDRKLMSENCTLKACPSPNCPGVFRILQDDEDIGKVDPFFCLFCGVNICRRWFLRWTLLSHLNIFCNARCCSVYHYGMTCQFYKIYRADDNHSLRVRFLTKYSTLPHAHLIILGMAWGGPSIPQTLPKMQVAYREKWRVFAYTLHQVCCNK